MMGVFRTMGFWAEREARRIAELPESHRRTTCRTNDLTALAVPLFVGDVALRMRLYVQPPPPTKTTAVELDSHMPFSSALPCSLHPLTSVSNYSPLSLAQCLSSESL